MASPVVTVTLGGTDISTRVGGPGAGASLRYGRGANWDGSAESPGYCVLLVQNTDKAFNPRNSGSSLASVLKIGKAVRVTCTYSAVTYYLFHGFLRRVVPLDDKWAELHCEDALFNFARRETNLAASATRSISDYRDAILDDIGESGSNRLLVDGGAEATVPYTGADEVNALSVLQELNRATGSVHFIRPTSAAYQYTVIDRTILQSNASAETWSDTDFANPFAESLGMFDYTDERIINQQRVEATPRLLEDDAVVVWKRSRIQVPASATVNRWARFDDPTFFQALTYTVESGSISTVTLFPFARSARVRIVASGSGVVLRDVTISGRRALATEMDASISDDSTSQTAYGILRGPTIASDYIFNEAYAQGLGDWYVWRYKDPRGNATPAFVNRFPTQLARDVTDRITYTSSEHNLSAVEFLIRGFETSVTDSGATWTTKYDLEEMPAAVSLFTIGGSAGQGVGGTGILAR